MSDISAVPPLTDQQVQEWRELDQGATAGPWRPDGNAVRTSDDYCAALTYMEPKGQRDRDAAFIAAARLAVPALIADRDRLVAENERLRAALCKISGFDRWPARDISAFVHRVLAAVGEGDQP